MVVHRRVTQDGTRHRGIPVTTPIWTLIDLAACLDRHQIEASVNEADKLDLVDPDSLRSAVDELSPRPGVAPLRECLDRRTFSLTDSRLERRFLRLVRRAGLPKPQTQQYLNGHRVDFFWPDLGLVVETDGLRYHRTPAQQAKDRYRDQAHTAAGLTPLRFTHAQIRYDPVQVTQTLHAVTGRLLRTSVSWQTPPVGV
jgi:very-short-patch-repair endonuclease